MRNECTNHKFVYDSALQTERLMNHIAEAHQRATQSYVRRPYGVGLLVAGYDRTGPHLFQTCPSGNMSEWKAYALGSRSQSARTYLERNFERFGALPREALLKEAARALHQCLEPEKELDVKNVVIAIVGKGEAFTVFEGEAVAPWIEGLGAAAQAGAGGGGAGGGGAEEEGEGEGKGGEGEEAMEGAANAGGGGAAPAAAAAPEGGMAE